MPWERVVWGAAAAAGILGVVINIELFEGSSFEVAALRAHPALAPHVAGGSTIATEAAFGAGQVGQSLAAGGFGLQVVGNLFGQIANQAIAARAKYQRWANTQSEALLNCTVATAPVAPATPWPESPATDSGSPEGAMAGALEKMAEGCARKGTPNSESWCSREGKNRFRR